MNFEQLRYVKEIVETKSMSIASQNLFITQSAISQSISMLEKELGITLFKRSRFGTHTTEDGKKVIQKILEILEKEHELIEESRIISSDFSGELKIATSPSIFMTFLLKALMKFKQDYPQINVTIEELEKNNVLQNVKNQTYDIGLILLFAPGEKLPVNLIAHSLHYEGSFNVLVPKESSLAFSDELQLKDIVKHPFILYDRHYFNELITQLEEETGPMNIILRTKSSEIVKRAVSEKIGITIVSSLMVQDDPYIESGKVIPIPLSGFPLDFSLKSVAIYLGNSPQSKLIKTFINYL